MLLKAVKAARGITTDAYDEEISRLIREGIADLRRLGISESKLTENDDLVSGAVITYACMKFKNPVNYDRLKASYDEQRAQLLSTSGYGLRKEADA